MEFELFGLTLKYENELFYQLKDNVWKPQKISSLIDGYQRIRLCKDKKQKQYRVHRVVYWLHNRKWNINNPKLIIDHHDRNIKNNNISNLRDLTQQENTFNTDAKGYCFDKRTNKYQAQIQLSGKKIYLGLFVNETDARQAYLAGKEKYHIIEVR